MTTQSLKSYLKLKWQDVTGSSRLILNITSLGLVLLTGQNGTFWGIVMGIIFKLYEPNN